MKHSSSSSKTRGRTAHIQASGQDQGTHMDMQRQIRNAGTNRATGKADHLHRGDRRDTHKNMK